MLYHTINSNATGATIVQKIRATDETLANCPDNYFRRLALFMRYHCLVDGHHSSLISIFPSRKIISVSWTSCLIDTVERFANVAGKCEMANG